MKHDTTSDSDSTGTKSHGSTVSAGPTDEEIREVLERDHDEASPKTVVRDLATLRAADAARDTEIARLRQEIDRSDRLIDAAESAIARTLADETNVSDQVYLSMGRGELVAELGNLDRKTKRKALLAAADAATDGDANFDGAATALAAGRGSSPGDRRREQKCREEQRQARLMGLEAEAILDERRAADSDARNEAALADTGSTTQTVKAALTDAEDDSGDSDPPEYASTEELVRSALAGEDTATVAKHDADPVAFVATVYDLDAARFDDEIALRDAISERQGTERVSIARQAWTAAQRDDATTELRAELSERLEDVDGFDA